MDTNDNPGDARRFDDAGNTRPSGTNYIHHDDGGDGLDRRGFLRCMAWAGTATVYAMSGGVPKSVAIGRIASAKGEFDPSPLLDTGQRYGLVFNRAGTYGYYCSLHPKMQGTVTVKAKP